MTTVHSWELWTDGSVYPNPGDGGWAFLLVCDGQIHSRDSGAALDQTNNTMELTAALMGLGHLRSDIPVTVVSDSAYLVNCFTQRWYEKWRKQGWRNSNHRQISSRPLWEALISCVEEREASGGVVTWRKVKGHSGVPLNEIVDYEAAQARKSLKPIEPVREVA